MYPNGANVVNVPMVVLVVVRQVVVVSHAP